MKPYPLRQRSTHLCAIIYRLRGNTSFTALYMAQHIFWNFFFFSSRLKLARWNAVQERCALLRWSNFFFFWHSWSLSFFFTVVCSVFLKRVMTNVHSFYHWLGTRRSQCWISCSKLDTARFFRLFSSMKDTEYIHPWMKKRKHRFLFVLICATYAVFIYALLVVLLDSPFFLFLLFVVS